MLKNNEDKICFYINKRIDSNIWYSTWHFKDVNTITLQTLTNDAQMTQKVIHIHEAYNSSLKDHKIIHEKENLSDIEKMLHMLKESILVFFSSLSACSLWLWHCLDAVCMLSYM